MTGPETYVPRGDWIHETPDDHLDRHPTAGDAGVALLVQRMFRETRVALSENDANAIGAYWAAAAERLVPAGSFAEMYQRFEGPDAATELDRRAAFWNLLAEMTLDGSLSHLDEGVHANSPAERQRKRREYMEETGGA
jgi:hypothetical protein